MSFMDIVWIKEIFNLGDNFIMIFTYWVIQQRFCDNLDIVFVLEGYIVWVLYMGIQVNMEEYINVGGFRGIKEDFLEKVVFEFGFEEGEGFR